MPKFMCSHSLPAGALKKEQVSQMAKAAIDDPKVKPYRSFLNLSEGKVFCILEAPDKETLGTWFKKMNMPYDYITRVELEGERGNVQDT